ncbi:MAG: hypothetical protein FWG87_02610 [Defluviitaleaceae bacterium]|nr:hypothetical protein [Defluviitaleaceae bacterium]
MARGFTRILRIFADSFGLGGFSWILKAQNTDFKGMERGFNGFTQISRIRSDLVDFPTSQSA